MTELVRMQFGSQLYGTATPLSDTDIKAVHLPSAEEILLGKSPRAINLVTKSDGTQKNTADDTDFESFSLHHFLKLLCDGQTVCLDMIFARGEALQTTSWQWEWIYENRKEFISRQCQSYIGYCRQQANKYGIKGSRVAAARAVLEYLKAEAEKRGHLARVHDCDWSWDLPEFAEVIYVEIRGQETKVPHLNVCNRKVPFGNTLKDAIAVYQRLVDEYGKRALMAESNEGVDWKALSHAVRIGRQAIQVLGGDDIIFPLPYAEYLTKIKKGEMPYQPIAEEIEDLLWKVESAAEKSQLPEHPNYALAESFILNEYADIVKKFTPRELLTK